LRDGSDNTAEHNKECDSFHGCLFRWKAIRPGSSVRPVR
jgi:hypothetical protein